MNKKIILTIPVYNGEKYIENTLKELDFFIKQNNVDLKVIFIDDGSKDKTKEKLILEKNNNYNFDWDFFSYQKNKGKGFAIKYVFDKIKDSDFIYFVFTDIELPYGLDFLLDLEKKENFHILVGSRKMEKIKQYNFYRKIMSKFFRFFLPKEIKKYSDTQCGMKIFDKNSANFIFRKIKTGRWVFDLEIFLVASKNDFKIIELPVIIKEKCIKNKGGVSIFRHGFFIIKDLLVIFISNKRKRYE